MTTRFFLSLAALFQGAGYFAASPGWLSAPIYEALNGVIPLTAWGAAYTIIGVLGMWRVYSRRSRPLTAWGVNIATMLVWSTGLLLRLMLGPGSLLSTYSVLTLMALWCLLRTEATERDTRTA